MSHRSMLFVRRLLYALIIPLLSIIHIALNTERGLAQDLRTIVDDMIPYMGIFTIPYLYWFAYIFGVIVFFAIVDYKAYFKLLSSISFGMILCFVIFYLYPTTVTRATDLGNGIFSSITGFIYGKDNPYNCFPSIHVLNAYLASLFLCKHSRKISVWSFSILSGVLISLSTMFIKQHNFLDAVASLIIGTVVYLIVSNSSIWNKVPLKSIVNFVIPNGVRQEYPFN